jgi:5'-3' exonuclease
MRGRLFLDFNCAIYYVIKPEFKTPETLITYTLEYLDTLCKLIPNLEVLYLALDGVPPRAKMEQQRFRRFHSVCKKNKAMEINQKYSRVGSGNELVPDITNYNFNLDTNMITPGTKFMKDLSDAIKKHLKDNSGKGGLYNGIKVLFSDANIPGEGEHKILNYIRENPSDENQYNIIYGLDGDLIMLSLVSQEQNLYLLREAAQYGGYAKSHEGHKYLFLNIDNLSKAILQDFQEHMSFELEYHKADRYIDDYIFLCFILGNDFMPKIHWYSLHLGGHDKLISSYFEVHNNTEEFLVDRKNMTINRLMLMDIFQMLMLDENRFVKRLFKRRSGERIPFKEDMTERERQQLLVDFYPLQHIDIEKNIDPYSKKWINRYYKTCFGFIGNPENINMVTEAYLKTLVWNFHYYFKECIDWNYFYPFHYSPTTSDIYYALAGVKQNNLASIYKFQTGNKPVDPQTLLLMVLPLSSCQFMASDIQAKLNITNTRGVVDNQLLSMYFPKDYEINLPFHRYYYECTAKIPRIDLQIINKFIKTCKLTDEEKVRNEISELFIL